MGDDTIDSPELDRGLVVDAVVDDIGLSTILVDVGVYEVDDGRADGGLHES